jgi:hypothetical protein
MTGSTSTPGQFGQLFFTGPQKAALNVFPFDKYDQTDYSNYLCEKINDYTCPSGSYLFDGLCYTLVSTPLTHAQADYSCSLMGGQLIQIKSRKQQTFINAAFPTNPSSYDLIWLDYRKVTYDNSDLAFRALDGSTIIFDSTGLDFTSSGQVSLDPAKNCVVMNGTDYNNAWTPISCFAKASYICQQPQQLAPTLVRTIPAKQLLLPLDLFSGLRDQVLPARANLGSLVAVTTDLVLPSGLAGAAHFLGKSNSNIKIDNSSPSKSIYSQFGVSVAMWIYIDLIYDGETQTLIDARPECVTGSETDEGFTLSLVNLKSTPALITSSPPKACSTVLPAFTVTTTLKQNVVLYAKLCNYNYTTVCQYFASPNTYFVPVQTWTHIGFTYNAVTQTGTFFIDNQYGYYNPASNSDVVGKYFSYDSGRWLTNSSSAAVSAPIQLGSAKYQQPGALAGKMSCLQWYEGPLTQSQFLYLSRCPVNATYPGKAALCPQGFYYYDGYCFKFSAQPQDFATAEAYCTSAPGIFCV